MSEYHHVPIGNGLFPEASVILVLLPHILVGRAYRYTCASSSVRLLRVDISDHKCADFLLLVQRVQYGGLSYDMLLDSSHAMRAVSTMDDDVGELSWPESSGPHMRP